MATISEVKTALDTIAEQIAEAARNRADGKQLILRAQGILRTIPTQHAAVLTEIEGYAPTGAFQTLAKDEKAKLATEFMALKTAIETELTALNVSYE
ncbi:hypothetical protein [Botrimarina mediterranea]|uniref:hypothetical protein n=1 Tax=Botrimarina mediterranea TaxID=2528022 RepID=UPI00118D09B7|nr:hypothetical protein K2D_16720 [Planctomycetes bacterium K2D]